MSPATSSLTPSRLGLARQRRGLTITTLARTVHVDPKTVTRWESGDSTPTPDSLARIAEQLDFPVEFFSASDVEELADESVSFRALSKTSAAKRNTAIASGRLAMEISDWIDARFRLPEPDVPTLPGYRPEIAAEVVRHRWGLGNEPISNIVHILEAHGVRVFSLVPEIFSVDAFSFHRSDGRPVVLVNTGKSGERQRFDLAHELGHLVLHCEEEIPHGREAELQAQRFAAALLMPREDVIAQPLRNADVEQILRARRRWKVAAMALTHRLHELEMITEWGYRDSCVFLSAHGFRRGEPGGINPETSQVLTKVLASLRTQSVSIAEMARELRLDVDELRLYLFGLVPVALPGGGSGGGERASLYAVTS
jgi:Zn-dependent peptidase ImmA (M78 family)